MKRGFALSLLISVLIMVVSSTFCFADELDFRTARMLASAYAEVAWIYGGAIAIAGIAIGIGIYFGLRSRSSK